MQICDGVVVAYNSKFVISNSWLVRLPTRGVLTLFSLVDQHGPIAKFAGRRSYQAKVAQKLWNCSMSSNKLIHCSMACGAAFSRRLDLLRAAYCPNTQWNKTSVECRIGIGMIGGAS